MKTNLYFAAGLLVLMTALMPLNQSIAQSQLRFDAETVQNWLEAKRSWHPKEFEAKDCLNTDFMMKAEAHCLTKQALYLLSEVNLRREAGLAAVRRTLVETDSKRLQASGLVDELLGEVEDLTQKVQIIPALEAENAELKAQISALETQKNTLSTANGKLESNNKDLIVQLEKLELKAKRDVELFDFTQQQILALETKIQSLTHQAQALKAENMSVTAAYKSLADKLRLGLLASLSR